MSQTYFQQRQKREKLGDRRTFWSTSAATGSDGLLLLLRRGALKLRPCWRDAAGPNNRAQKTLVYAILSLAMLYFLVIPFSTTFSSSQSSSSSLSIRSLSRTTGGAITLTDLHSRSEDILWTLIIPGHSRSVAEPPGDINDVDDNEEEGKEGEESDNSLLPDYGGLVFVSLKGNKHTGPIEFQRHIRPDDHEQYHEEKLLEMKQMNQEYISKRHWSDEDLEEEQESMECRRPSWEHLHFPFCNVFHEVDLTRHYDRALAQRSGDNQEGDSFYLSHGYFRDVFSISYDAHNKASSSSSTSAVMKVARYTKHDINYRAMYNARRDALVMERLSGKDNIVDIYGYCGSSVMVESLPNEVEEVIVPSGGWMSHEDLNDSHDLDVQNDYEVTEKLMIAIEMAESISELHGFQDGVIVHDDIQLCQWLRNDQGKLKLGDFNRARVLHWNDKKQEYCKYENGKSYGNYRSPEEYDEKPLSQQHDVWSFGNNIYALLTGLWIFYDNEDDEVVAGKVVNGSIAYIDERYRTRSFIEGRLVEVMERCWVYDQDKRADIFEVVNRLRQILKESKQQQKIRRR